MVKRLLLLILPMLFTTAAYAAQEDSFSAKLRIDNKVEMKWTVSDNDAVYVKIYGTDEGGENYVPVEERLPAADSGYMFDFIARGVDYSDFYTFVTLGADGTERGSLFIGEEILDFSAAGKYVAVLTASDLRIYDETLTLYASTDNVAAATDVIQRADGSAILISGGSGTLFIP